MVHIQIYHLFPKCVLQPVCVVQDLIKVSTFHLDMSLIRFSLEQLFLTPALVCLCMCEHVTLTCWRDRPVGLYYASYFGFVWFFRMNFDALHLMLKMALGLEMGSGQETLCKIMRKINTKAVGVFPVPLSCSLPELTDAD